jgi:hypothetical protein
MVRTLRFAHLTDDCISDDCCRDAIPASDATRAASCPALCRASTPYFRCKQDVDGRDEPGQTVERLRARLMDTTRLCFFAFRSLRARFNPPSS